MAEFETIADVRHSVVACKKCDLCKSRINAVPGKGSSTAKIVFVGEAPGQSEDARGEPFVGAAGSILDDALAGAGIARESVYITNTIKCRPPSNRVPTSAERAACADYLAAEIRLISPDVVCIMGNTAYASILGGTGITRNRGKLVHHDGVNYFLTIHPAAVIYNSSLADALRKDIKTIAGMVCGA